MKLMIASDLHGSAYFVKKLMERMEQEQPDKILLLGDLLYHGPRNALPEEYSCPSVADQLNAIQNKILAVRGNCDSEVDQMVLEFPMMSDYAMLEWDGLSLFATHGHLWSGGTSPVPGGISINNKSISFQITSVQNCNTVPEITIPLQTTGEVASSKSRFMDISCIPEGESTVSIPSSLPVALSVTPNIWGMDGPVISASMIPTDIPFFCASEASKAVVSDFPTPPFPLTTPITFFIDDFLCGSFKKLSCFLDEQEDEEQLEQL